MQGLDGSIPGSLKSQGEVTHEKDKGTVTGGVEEVRRGGWSQCGNLRARSALEGPKHREVPRPDLHF